MSTTTGKNLNLVKPEVTDDIQQTIGTDLPSNFQKIDDEFTAHKAKKAPHISLAVKAHHSVAQSLADATETLIHFDTNDFDNDGIHDITTNDAKFVCQTAGKYLVWAKLNYAANSTGLRYIKVYLNGSGTDEGYKVSTPVANSTFPVECLFVIELNVGDELTVYGRQTSGASLNVNWAIFAMFKVGD